jgi:hypothetical protein
MERVRVFGRDSEPVEAEVYRVVNVAENPELREAALRGTLHRLDDGEVIDVPFIYHDPVAQRFVLVIPHAARGRELSERAKLLDSLMKEHEEDVPDYLRHFVIVFGRHGLDRYLEDLQTMEFELAELEPLDGRPLVASRSPQSATLLPPSEFWAHASAELALLIDDEELWIFVQLGADEHDALTDRQTNAVRRAYLNPQRSADERILELLRRDFHATVVVSTDHRQLLRSFRLDAPRAGNAKMILDRTALAPEARPGRWQEAVEACRLTPPPSRRDDHPFELENVASSAAEALGRLERLQAWTSPKKVEEALLVMSVPRPVFELSRRRLVSDAVRLGLAPDAQQLVAVLERNFEQTLSAASVHGLCDSQIQPNRKALARLCQMQSTSTAPGLSCNMEH